MRVAVLGAEPPIPPARVRRAVRAVLAGERAGDTTVSVTQLSPQRMRALNRRTFGRDRATDVIAFGMHHAGQRVADVYVCPSEGTKAARRLGIPAVEEHLRLVVHGTLHALGYDHPAGLRRTASPMWRRQERYVRALRGGRSQ